jgi:hypothetical protein
MLSIAAGFSLSCVEGIESGELIVRIGKRVSAGYGDLPDSGAGFFVLGKSLALTIEISYDYRFDPCSRLRHDTEVSAHDVAGDF